MLRTYGVLIVLAAAAPAVALQSEAPQPPAPVICHAASVADDDPNAVPPPAKALLKGYGTGGFQVRTSNPEAQAYFDNGMQLAHAFAHKAAIAAFRHAEELDPNCAMCAWGEAWSRGPTINYPIDKKTQADLVVLADKAAVLAEGGPAKERALIAALQKRYHDGGGAGRGDVAFAAAMDDLAKADPDDNEIAVVAADAWMIPWAGSDGSKGRLDRAVELLEGALKRKPDDTAAIHFYIHATEGSGFGTRALPYAEKLQALAPAASHLVHMPSHTYFWAGRYRQAEQSNLDAVAIDQANAERLKPQGGVFGLGYHNHNVQYGEGAALMDGDAKGGLMLAKAQLDQISATKVDPIYRQLLKGSAYYVYGRYAARAEVAALPAPGADEPLAVALWRYAQGEAAARGNDVAGVKAAIKALQDQHADLKGFRDFRPRAQALMDMACLVLTGREAMLEQRWDDAEAAYRKAAEIQDDKISFGGDPPVWWYPVRRSLAAALLADGKTAQAEAEAKTVLTRWFYDPQTLRILAEAAAKLGRPDEARRQLDYARSNWTGELQATPLSGL